MNIFCVHCGNSVKDEGRFCSHCGRIATFHSIPKHSYRALILFLSVFFVLAFSGWQIYDRLYSNLSHVVFSQLSAIKENEITRAYYEFTSEEFKTKTSLLSFKEFIKTKPVFSKNCTMRIIGTATSGDKGELNAELMANDDEKADVSYQFVKEKGKWKIAKIRLKDIAILIDEEDEGEIKRLIECQINALKKSDVPDAYYPYTSKDFQRFTSLSSFQEFVDFFSMMQQCNSIQYHELKFEDGQARWDITLMDNQNETDVTYIFCKEKGDWKILGIQFREHAEEAVHYPIDIVDAQLQAIRSHEVAKAYFEFTSKEFRKKTTLRDFKTFIKMQESFYHNRDAQLHIALEEKNSVTILALLKSMGTEMMTVEYELVLEDDVWKIDQIQLKASMCVS